MDDKLDFILNKRKEPGPSNPALSQRIIARAAKTPQNKYGALLFFMRPPYQAALLSLIALFIIIGAVGLFPLSADNGAQQATDINDEYARLSEYLYHYDESI